jgi:hypothetical protein
MRIFCIFAIASFLAFHISAQTLVPNSTSPDGKTALYYTHPPTIPLNDGYEVYFCDPHSLTPLSGNLIPKTGTDYTTAVAMDEEELDTLLSRIGSHFEAPRRHVLWDTGFEYFVAWSPDSQWVSIEGGAHKFWKVTIYHLKEGRFQRVMLSDPQFSEYFNLHKNDLQVPDLGAAAAIRKISPRNYDYPDVCWLGNGLLAINALPYLLNDPEYEKLETRNDPRYENLDTQDFFYLLDTRTQPATITGFCR